MGDTRRFKFIVQATDEHIVLDTHFNRKLALVLQRFSLKLLRAEELPNSDLWREIKQADRQRAGQEHGARAKVHLRSRNDRKGKR